MTIVSKPKNEGLGILAPDGLQAAICCDEEDLGEVYSEFYKKSSPKIRLHFLLAETIPAKWKHPHTGEVVDVPEELVGRPFGLSRRFTASLGEKAALRQFLKTWRGRDFSPQELEAFDTESLIGVPCALSIVHSFSDQHKKWFANIEGVSKLPASWDAPTIPADYKRRKDRDGNGPYQNNPDTPTATAEEYGYGPETTGDPIPESIAEGLDDDLPF